MSTECVGEEQIGDTTKSENTSNTCTKSVIGDQVCDLENGDTVESKELHSKKEKMDAFCYTKRTHEFTSEIFKIEVGNLPKFFGYKQFKKIVESQLNFKPVKIKAIPGAGFAFVTFRSEEERQKALTTLKGYKWKGKFLTTKLAKAIPDPVASKRAKQDHEKFKEKEECQDSLNNDQKCIPKDISKDGEDSHDLGVNTTKPEERQSTPERLNSFVTPLWNTPYTEQIKIKFQCVVTVLEKLVASLNQMSNEKISDPEKDSSEVQSVLCVLMPCIPSPILNGYRNKCEFTIAEGPDKEKTIGFRAGSYKDGFTGVLEPSHCIHITDTAKKLANVFQKFIRESALSVFDAYLHTGYWQTLTVRTSQLGESMAVIQIHPQNLTKPELDGLFKDIITFFTEKEGKDCQLSSLFVQVNTTRGIGGVVNVPLTLLFGEPYIHEVLHDVKFRISPEAFFQVNVQAADQMFNIMREWMGDCNKSVLLDICCGTGTIGLCLAKYVSEVIGIELVESAIEDAKKNAEMNNIKNAAFIAGKAEDVLVEQVLKKLPIYKPVIGIADPPRAGLHRSVIHGIRRCTRMNQLIYVACNANNAFTNLVDLCRPVSKRIKSPPFRLVKAIPIDFFPHTQHCELIMLFERDNVPSKDLMQFHLQIQK